MTVTFNSIPSNLRIPGIWNELAEPAQVGGANLRVLLIGQTILAMPAVPTLAPSLSWVRQNCGAGSMLAQMMWAYRLNDPTGEVWILPLADAGGATAATASLSITAPSTAPGTLSVYVGGIKVAVAVAAAQSATSVAAALVAACNANPNLSVTATVDGTTASKVDFTSKNSGRLPDDLQLSVNYLGVAGGEALPAGMTVSIGPFASGTNDPDLVTPLATLGKLPFEIIVNPYNSSPLLAETTALMNEQTGRWSWSQMLFGHVVSSRRGASAGAGESTAAANLVTFAGAAAVNDAHLTLFGFYGKPWPAWNDAAAHAAQIIVAVRADNAPPPIRNVTIQGDKPPAPPDQFSIADEQLLLTNGIALDAFAPNNTSYILRAITTYQTNLEGVADTSYLDCETMFGYAAVIRFFRGRLATKFARCKLAKDGTNFGAGSSKVVTPKIIKAEMIACYGEMIDLGWVDDLDTFAANVVVEINAQDPTRVDMFVPPELIPGLAVIASQSQLSLG